VIFYFMNLNPWFGLPVFLWLNSVIVSQAIGYGALMVYVERFGWFKGSLIYMRLLIFPVFPFATAITPQYAISVLFGFLKLTKFLNTGGKGGALSRYEFNDLYFRTQYSIIPGTLLLLLVTTFAFYDPLKLLMWSPQILTISYGWLLGPFLFNPILDKKNK